MIKKLVTAFFLTGLATVTAFVMAVLQTIAMANGGPAW